MKSEKIYTYDVYNNKYIADTNKLNISVHVYGIVIENEKILISPQFDGYDFPDGTAEKGETHINTLVREIKEETGYLVEPIELLNIYTSFFHHTKKNKDYQSYLIYYLVKIVGGEISNAGFDKDEKEYAKTAKWVSIKELKNMRHANSINVVDELIKNDKKIKNKIILDSNSKKWHILVIVYLIAIIIYIGYFHFFHQIFMIGFLISTLFMLGLELNIFIKEKIWKIF